jgi:HEAT repeat protein
VPKAGKAPEAKEPAAKAKEGLDDRTKPTSKEPPKEPPRPKEGRLSSAKKEEPKTDSALAPVLAALKSKDPHERLKAIEKLGRLGEDAKPALRPLCEVMVTDRVPAIRQSALGALEKVYPALYKPVVTLFVEVDPSKHTGAIRAIAALGEEGRGAVPVLLAHIKDAALKHPLQAPELSSEDIEALAKVAPDELAVQSVITQMTLFTAQHPTSPTTEIGLPTRMTAVRVLGELAARSPERAKNVTPGLVKATGVMTDAEVRRLALTVLGTIAENHEELRAQIAPALMILVRSGEVQAIPALAKCGRAAEDALPLLKQLKLHPQTAVREAATDAVSRIEDALATPVAAGPRPAPPPSRKDELPKAGRAPARKDESDLPRKLRPLVAKLRRGTTQERVKAAEGLAALGEQAAPAARALCEAALQPTQKVSRAALKALEAVNPDLAQPVFVLIVDAKADNHRQAITKLVLLGEQAKPALPVLLSRIKTCEEQLLSQGGGWGQPTLVTVTLDLLTALPKIAPEEPPVLQTIIEASKFTMPGFVFTRRGTATKTPFQEASIPLLGDLAEAVPAHQKRVVPTLVGLLKEQVQSTNSTQDLEVLQAIQEVERIVSALLKCGKESRQALVREVTPRLRDLLFHRSEQVRNSARTLSKSIEENP